MGGIFKAYDIRGIYPEEIDEEVAERIGRAFITSTGAERVLVGRDARNSSPPLANALIKGIIAAGADVLNIGLVTTPMIKMMQQHLGYGHAIQVTASHNPKEYGGMKLYAEDAQQITGADGLPEIERLVASSEFTDAQIRGTITKQEIMDDYTDLLAAHITTDLTQLHVIVDASNGPAGKVCESLFPKINIQYSALNFEPDGDFPGHDPNPLSPGATKQAAAAVAEQGADLGCVFDADADRAVFIDEQGRPVPRGNIAAMIARDCLAREPGAAIVYDVVSSHVVKEAVEQAGGKPLLNRTGAAFMARRMREEQAIFGAEDSGHYFYRDMKDADHAVYTLLRVMQIVAKKGEPLSAIARPNTAFYDTGQINIPVKDAAAAVKRVADAFKDHDQTAIDGVMVDFKDGKGTWLIARPSNTEPLLRLRMESKDEQRLQELREQVVKIVG
ncbi:phosphomannomutase/phosphoglucomutase [Candidatus Woesearchaeota archaeon]|nr:phosphomannomutase/phosphoglucomutase [Candidatus Woesearchaeota archaeon]